MNRKGITLPVVILIVISFGLLFTGLYTYFDSLKNNENEITYQDQVDLIIESAKLWVKNNGISGDIRITLCELQKNDYIGELINPINDKVIPNDSFVVYENNNYVFKSGNNNLKVCANDIIYLELDASFNSVFKLDNEYDDIKEIIIKENGDVVDNIYINKKTTYEVIYILDSNVVKTNYVVVRDTTSPSINVDLKKYNYNENTNTIFINKYDEFNLPNVIITDNGNSKITTDVINNVDTYITGNYMIGFVAVDEDNNRTEKNINVIVQSNNLDENYYVDTNKYTNKKEIVLKLKGLDTKEVCISNSSICDDWITYKENINWVLDDNNKVYVYYKTNSDNIYMKVIDVYFDNNNPVYLSSNKVLYGISYDLIDVINAHDESGIKTITSNSLSKYKPLQLGLNKLSISIFDNANNVVNQDISLVTYKNIKCDNSISSVVNEDGLVKDGARCIYVGKNPDNYIKFNDELYRIVSIENNGKIKIVKNDSLSKENYSNSWSASNLRTYLINYYNGISSNILTNEKLYYGDLYNPITIKNVYDSNNKRFELANIGLLSINDYLKAGLCDGNTMWDKVLNNNPCKDNNWLYDNREYWLINSLLSKVLYVTSDGNVSYTYEGKKDVRPVLYLRSNIGIVDGDGSLNRPYIIDESIEETNVACTVNTSPGFELSKTLIVNSLDDVLVSFDGISFSNNNKMDVKKSGIITAYVKKGNVYCSCSIRLYEEYEYRYKDCLGINKVYDDWYVASTTRESIDFVVVSKNVAEMEYLDHYEVVDSTPCNNCKWVTKYERKVKSCKSFDDSVWSNWSNLKPDDSSIRLIDSRIKYGMR